MLFFPLSMFLVSCSPLVYLLQNFKVCVSKMGRFGACWVRVQKQIQIGGFGDYSKTLKGMECSSSCQKFSAF